jgi:hypothetical protein
MPLGKAMEHLQKFLTSIAKQKDHPDVARLLARAGFRADWPTPPPPPPPPPPLPALPAPELCTMPAHLTCHLNNPHSAPSQQSS